MHLHERTWQGINVSMKRFTAKPIVIAMSVGILFWIADSMIDVYVFKEGTLLQQIFAPNATESGMRIAVLVLLALQGIYLSRILRRGHEQKNRLAHNDELLRDLFAATSSCIKLVDRKGVIISMNQAGLGLLELDPDENPKGVNVLEFIHPDLRESFIAANERALKGESIQTTFKIVGKRGRELDVRSTIEPFRDKSGKITGTLAVTSDITKDLEDERIRRDLESKMHEAQKLEGLGLVAGGVAHDFNNILVGIMGNADLAARNSDADTDVHQYCEDILSSASRAAELCAQLLAYTGKRRYTIEPTNLSRQIKALTPVIEGANLNKSKITYDLSQESVIAEVDPIQFNQVMINMIVNALEAVTREGGHVEVSTHITPAREAVALKVDYGEINPGTPCATVRVTDNGNGLTNTQRRRIFEPFYSSKEKGRGLGLAAVMGFVRSCFGGIKVDSLHNEGTVFTIYLPLSDKEVAPESPTARPEVTDLNRRILIIDDEDIVRNVTERMLQQAGSHTITAPNGRDGVMLFQEHQDTIDLILVDYAMPGLNGLETMRKLHEIRPEVPVILISGYSNNDHIQGLSDVGFATTLQKPFTSDRLLQTVQEVLANQVDLQPSE